MAKVTFDGDNLLIRVNTGVENIDVGAELYSEWKRWMLLSDNAKYLQAFRTLGGDATNPDETQFAPRYYFLMNGWRVYVDGNAIVFQINLYTDEGESPFIVVNGGAVTNRASDVPIIKSEIDKVLDYGGVVHVDIDNGFSGIEHPVGTLARPSNNLIDAKVICDDINSHTITLLSNIVLTESVDGYYFLGGLSRSTIDLNGVSSHGCRFHECDITGVQNSPYNIYEKCRINELYNFAGAMIRCYFMTTVPITVQPFIPIMITDCRSAISGNGSPVFDYSAGNIDLSLRAYSGGIRVINSTSPANTSTLEFIAGRFNFDNTTNTHGFFSVRGSVDCDGVQMPINTNVVISNSGALCRQGIAKGVWEDVLSKYVVDGTAGNVLANINPDDIAQAVWVDAGADALKADVAFIKSIEGGRWQIVNNEMIFFADDNITEVARFDLLDQAGNPTDTNVFQRVRQ